MGMRAELSPDFCRQRAEEARRIAEASDRASRALLAHIAEIYEHLTKVSAPGRPGEAPARAV
jgi:hypothetical protein